MVDRQRQFMRQKKIGCKTNNECHSLNHHESRKGNGKSDTNKTDRVSDTIRGNFKFDRFMLEEKINALLVCLPISKPVIKLLEWIKGKDILSINTCLNMGLN